MSSPRVVRLATARADSLEWAGNRATGELSGLGSEDGLEWVGSLESADSLGTGLVGGQETGDSLRIAWSVGVSRREALWTASVNPGEGLEYAHNHFAVEARKTVRAADLAEVRCCWILEAVAGAEGMSWSYWRDGYLDRVESQS